ncbi:MAG: TRIC cation channel family protein [Chloroflexota bacterium]
MDLSALGDWTLGSFVIVDLVAATTNAFNGAILARQPSHYRGFTLVGILLIAVLGGIGGGVSRDILLNDVPSALTNPWYLILCTVAAVLALRVAASLDQSRLSRLFDFMATFSLPWYAVVGTSKALDMDLPLVACVLIGVVGPTAGRFFIDLTCGVTPQHFVRGEWFVGTAVLASIVYIVLEDHGFWFATFAAFLVGFSFRFAARRLRWEEPLPNQSDGTAVLSS